VRAAVGEGVGEDVGAKVGLAVGACVGAKVASSRESSSTVMPVSSTIVSDRDPSVTAVSTVVVMLVATALVTAPVISKSKV